MINCRTVFVSDFHLGTTACQSQALLNFLQQLDCRQLYLVGDIIDLWELKDGTPWPRGHEAIIQYLWELSTRIEIIYVVGNHDAPLRHLAQKYLGHIRIEKEVIHVAADGKRYWVVHGDAFDAHIQFPLWMTRLGDRLSSLLSIINRRFNRCRELLRIPYWSLANAVKQANGKARAYIDRYAMVLVNETRSRGLDGVICGHIHFPETRIIDGVLYANDGDWVDSRSALIENCDGHLSLYFDGMQTAAGEILAATETRQAA